jgi:hypothetical protein
MSARVSWLRRAQSLSILAALGVLIAIGVGSAAVRSTAAHPAIAPCADQQLSASRDPINPLALPTPPGADPIHGVHLFVDGPAHGTVAKAIEALIGDTTAYTNTDTWSEFVQSLTSGALAPLVNRSATLAREVMELVKIGNQATSTTFCRSRPGKPLGRGYPSLPY